MHDRAQAAHTLLRSLDEESADSDAEEAKIAELVRRAQEVADGSVETIDGAEVRARVVARLRALRQ